MKDRLNRMRQKAAECGVTKSNIAVVWIAGVMLLSLVAAPVAGQTAAELFDGFEDGTDQWNPADGTSLTIKNDHVYQGNNSVVYTEGTGVSATASVTQSEYHSVGVAVYMPSSASESNTFILRNVPSDFAGVKFSNGNVLYSTGGSSHADTGMDYQPDTWYYVIFELDYNNNTYTMSLNRDGQEVANETGIPFANNVGALDTFRLGNYGTDGGRIDHITLNPDGNPVVWDPAFVAYTVSGTVVDSENEPIANATVTADTGESAMTGPNGKYSFDVESGTRTFTATKTGYIEKSKTVDITSNTENVDFELQSLDESIEIDTRNYIKHGETAEYEIIVDNGTGRTVVTGESNVTSNNTTIVTVDSQAHELIATSDTSVNGETYITAEYTDSKNRTFVATQNVTVANATVENLEILPPMWRMGASFGSPTIQAILVAVFMGVFAGRVAGAFAGLGMMQLVMVAGWFIGYVGVGMAMISLFTALFIGLNMAANIDYTVTR